MASIIYTDGLANKLGITVEALRARLQRGDETLPPPFRQGRKLAWNVSTVEEWYKRIDCKALKRLA